MCNWGFGITSSVDASRRYVKGTGVRSLRGCGGVIPASGLEWVGRAVLERVGAA